MRWLRLQRVPQASLSGSFSHFVRLEDFHILLPACVLRVFAHRAPPAVKVTGGPFSIVADRHLLEFHLVNIMSCDICRPLL